jgi:hypothetical protein
MSTVLIDCAVVLTETCGQFENMRTCNGFFTLYRNPTPPGLARHDAEIELLLQFWLGIGTEIPARLRIKSPCFPR